MSRRRVVALVIDADVACARPADICPDSPARAVAAKNALEAVRECETLVVAFGDELYEEWNRHRSTYAAKWRTNMHGRKRIRRYECPGLHSLRKRIADLPSVRERDEGEKDAHLVELALVADRRILSLDDEARAIFARLASVVRRLLQIRWASPINDGCTSWLMEGAPRDDRYRL